MHFQNIFILNSISKNWQPKLTEYLFQFTIYFIEDRQKFNLNSIMFFLFVTMLQQTSKNHKVNCGFSVSSIREHFEGIPDSFDPAEAAVHLIGINMVPQVPVGLKHWMLRHEIKDSTRRRNRLENMWLESLVDLYASIFQNYEPCISYLVIRYLIVFKEDHFLFLLFLSELVMWNKSSKYWNIFLLDYFLLSLT